MLPTQKSSALGLALFLTTVATAKPLASIVVPPIFAQAAPTPFPLPTSVPPGTTVKIDGSSSMAAVNQALKQRFESQFSGSNINLNYSGTPPSLQSLRDGKIDLAAIGRPLTQAERDQGLVPVAVERGKIALIVNPENPFKGSITVPQFVKIVRGEITDWSELGGESGKIRFVDRPDLSDTRAAFRNYSVFIQTPYELGNTAARTGEDSTQSVAQQLGKDGLSYAPANQVLNQPSVRIVPMHNTLPTDPRYPFSQPFYYVHKADPSPGALAFLGYATADAGRQIARSTETDPASLSLNPATLLAAGSAAVTALNSGAGSSPSPTQSPTSAQSPAGTASPATANGSAGTSSGAQTVGAVPPGSGGQSSDSGLPGWLWWLLPLGLGALLLGWLLRNRRSTPPAAQTPVTSPPPEMTPPPPPPLMTPMETDGSLASRAGSVITSDRASIAEVQSLSVPPEVALGGAALAGAAAIPSGQTSPPAIEPETPPVEAPTLPIVAESSIAEPPSVQVPERPLVEIREMPPIEAPTSAIEPPEAPPENDLKLPNGAVLGGVAGLGAAGAAAWMSRTRSGEPPQASVSEPLTTLDAIEPLDEVEDAALDQPAIELELDDAPTIVEEVPPLSTNAAPDYVQMNLADDMDSSTNTPENAESGATIETTEPGSSESIAPTEDLAVSQGIIPGIAMVGGAAVVGAAGLAGLRQAQPEGPPPSLQDSVPETAQSPVELSEIDAGTDLETDEFTIVDSQIKADEPNTIAEEPSVSVEPPQLEATSVPDTSIEAGSSIPGIAALGGIGLALGLMGLTSDRAQTEVEAARFGVEQSNLSSEALASVDEGLPGLPEGYGESRIVLMPRDPQWAYAYWDIPNEHKSELRNQGGQNLVLRLYDVTDVDLAHQSPHRLQQFECNELARDWYLPIPVSDREYLTEIGYMTADGRWLMLERSLPVRVPPAYPSAWEDEQFVTVDWEKDLSDKTVFTLTSPILGTQTIAAPNGMYDRIFDLSQGAELQRIAGSIFGSMQQIPTDSLRSFSFPSGIGMGAFRTASGISGMSGIGMSGIGMGGAIRPRRFWLVADAELIVYGATEPDATVSIAGETIPLNPDGTFRFQMSFQDGLIDYPILAVANDGDQTRSIHLKFNRETPSRNTNTKDEANDEWQS